MKAAVIGCGRMGAEPSARLEGSIPAGWLPMSHAECLKRLDGVELVALSDTDPNRLERHGRHYGVTRLYVDYRRLLDEVRPDIVGIATRTPSKVSIVRDACAHGVKGIYVEKPLANSLVECRKALAAANETGTKVVYGVNRRYHAVYRHARELVMGGEIGEVIDVTVEFGRSQLLWNHPHSVDLMLFFLNTTRVIDVQARLSDETVVQQSPRLIDSDPIIEQAHFTFESGAGSTIGKFGGCNVRIGGSRGTLTVHADGSYIQVSRPRGGQHSYFLDQVFLHTPPAPSATLTALAEMQRALQAPEVNPITPEEIEVGLRMLMGCVWSHLQGGRPVSAREVPDDLAVTGRYGDVYA